MAKDFATTLAEKIQSHKEFWDDLAHLQVAGIRASVLNDIQEKSTGDYSALVARLLYSASIFSQTATEENRSLAQTIALNAMFISADGKIRERTKRILADIGNFPSVQYLADRYDDDSSSFLSALHIALLRTINSVQIGEVELPLTDFQFDVWSSLPKTKATSISAPTSAGKSFLVIEHICRKVITSSSLIVVYVAPTRALLAEVHRKISDRLTGISDVRVSTIPSLDSEKRSRQVFVLTQERLHVLLSVTQLKVDMVIVDEAQNIADGTRGMILQDCLERLRGFNDEVQLLLLSPGADGFQQVGSLLGFDSIDVKETTLSPVLQNRILVKVSEGHSKQFTLSLLGPKGTTEIGNVPTQRGVTDSATRLAAAALELARQGGALVYATGPVQAEGIAAQLASDLPVQPSSQLKELSKFIKEHIHSEYGLASMVLHGVAFHYGRMPTLLREAIERSFRLGHIHYLVCTTTLFQGVNLPARSVFINTPTRGRGVSLEAAHLWNFAGRAGRLGQDLVGNVFLIDYDQWEKQVLDKPAKYQITAAFSEVVEHHFETVIDAVGGDMPKWNPRDSMPRDVRAAAGLLLARASNGHATVFLERHKKLSQDQRQRLVNAAEEALDDIGLPGSVIENNWTVDIYGLKRLADRMRVKVMEGAVADLIPIHPREPNAHKRYAGIFSRIAREILGYKVVTYGGFIATYALPWMYGMPYPVLLAKWISFQRKQKPNAAVNDLVRTAFDFIEDVLRFQMVQLGKAYVDVLYAVLDEVGLSKRKSEVFDFSLALELGVSSSSGRAFIELGVSRITALALEALFPDSELTSETAKKRLEGLDISAVSLSPVIVAELRQLGLLPSEVV